MCVWQYPTFKLYIKMIKVQMVKNLSLVPIEELCFCFGVVIIVVGGCCYCCEGCYCCCCCKDSSGYSCGSRGKKTTTSIRAFRTSRSSTLGTGKYNITLS